MIAGGTGITPMLQVLDHILAAPGDKTKVGCKAVPGAAGHCCSWNPCQWQHPVILSCVRGATYAQLAERMLR
jgi:hypothetical protein